MSVSLSPMDGPGDAELIAAVRGGDVDAYGELFARHVDAARRLARQLAGPSDAEDLVSDAFTKVLLVLQRGGGPDLAFRAYLLTAVRRLHVDRVRSGARLRPVDDLTPFDPGLPFQDTAVEGFDNAAAARAFASLPERWQMVLWHTEVEQQKPADVAPLLGMSANSVSALAYRAREGLRQAFLSQHAADPDDVDCSWTRDHLGAYIRGGLSRRDAARVDDHLESCRACAAVYLELTEVNSGLALILAPLLLGTAGAAYLTSTGAVGSAATGLTATWTATKTFLGGHTAVTAVGGVMLTAVASVAVYVGAHAMLANPATDTAGGLGGALHSATGPANPGGTGPAHGPGGSHHRSTDGSSSGTDPSLTTPSSSATLPTTTDTSTSPTDSTSTDSTSGTDPSSGTTTEPGGPTDPTSDPTSQPTNPGGPGDDDLTFSSVPPAHPSFGDTYELKASGGSGAVTFSIDDATTNHACTLAGSTVTFRHAGTCVINASQGGHRSARAAAKPVQQTIVVPQASQAISFTSDAPSAPTFGETYQLTATGGDSGNPVTFSLDPDATTNNACTLDGATVTYRHAGACAIDADQAGTDDYAAAKTITQTASVPKASQAISFTSDAPSAPTFGESYQLSALGGDSGNPVTFSLDPDATTNNACTLDGATVTYHHAGTCAIDADQAGTDDYAAAKTITQTASVPKASQAIIFTSVPPVDPGFGDTYQLSALGGDSGNPVTFSLDPDATTNNACTLDGATVTYHHAGACAIDADQAGTDDYLAAKTVTQTGSVPKASQTISFTSTPPRAPAFGDTYEVTATSSSGLPVAFSIDPTTTNGACTLDGSTVTYRHAGTCTIEADQAGDDDYAAAPATRQNVAVPKAQQQIIFTSLPPTTPALGTTYQLSASGGGSGNPVTFSLDPATTHGACTLDGSTVTYRHAGTCTIDADQAGDDDYLAAETATQSAAVPQAQQQVSFTSTPPPSPAFGDTYLVTATSTSGLPVTFSIDPATTNNACTLDGAKVTYRHAGTCVIDADQAGNDDYAKADTATQRSDVPKAHQQVSFTSTPPPSPAFGDTYLVTATSTSGLPVTFSIDPATTNNACTLDGAKVTYRHAGTCVIDADQAGNDDYAKADTATQRSDVPKARQSVSFTSYAPGAPGVGDTYAVTASSTSGLPVNLSVAAGTTNNACTLDGSTVTYRHVGTCVIAAAQAGNDDYQPAATQTQKSTVHKGVQTISFGSSAPASPAVGDTYAVTATSTSGLPVNLSVAAGTTNNACTLDGSTVTYRHVGTCVIAAAQAGNDDYQPAATQTQKSTVHKAAQTISFTTTPPSPGLVGSTYTVNATGGGSGNAVGLSSSTTTVCTISGSTVTFRATGSCRIVATQAGNADYDAAPQATQTIEVAAPATDLSLTAKVFEQPPTSNSHWHRVDLTVRGLAAGSTATVTGSSKSIGVVVLPQFNCWFEQNGICHVTSPPLNPTVTFYVYLPSSTQSAKVTFTAASDTSPDPDPSNNSVTVTIHPWDDDDSQS